METPVAGEGVSCGNQCFCPGAWNSGSHTRVISDTLWMLQRVQGQLVTELMLEGGEKASGFRAGWEGRRFWEEGKAEQRPWLVFEERPAGPCGCDVRLRSSQGRGRSGFEFSRGTVAGMGTWPARWSCAGWRTGVRTLGMIRKGQSRAGALTSIAFWPGKAQAYCPLVVWFRWQVPSALWTQAKPQRYPVPPPGGLLSLLRVLSAWKVLVYWFLQLQLPVC